MSYDVFVFDPDVAPQNRESFLAWWEGIISSDTTGDESSPDGASENIRDFYELLKEQFPPMNGPDAACNFDQIPVERVKKVGFWKRLLGQTIKDYSSCEDLRVSDYIFFGNSISLNFSWPVASEAHQEVVKAAIETGVGFFDACGDEGIYRDKEQLRELIE